MLNKPKYKIGIIGIGMVGGALNYYFETAGIETHIYDKYKHLGSIDEVNSTDIVFICVPTPYDDKKNGFDIYYVEDAVNNLAGEKIVVIKSTVLPGTTEKLQKKFDRHKFLFNPEFLVEKTARNDMCNPDRQIIGSTDKSSDIAENIMKLLPKAPFQKVISATEAEMVKYFANTFLATKVIFANQMYDMCEKLGINYDVAKECAAADRRIGSSHLDVNFDNYRGYGGKCLPKDMKAFIQLADECGVDLKLHKVVENINDELTKKNSNPS